MNASSYEGTVVISCDQKVTTESIICKILGRESLPDTVSTESGINGYQWSFSNKYYSSKVNLYALKEKADLDTAFVNNIKAIIIYFEGQEQSCFEKIESWFSTLINIDAEVKLLWCVEHEYELVELNPFPENDDDEGEINQNPQGYERVSEALQSHTWANLVLLEDRFAAKESPKEGEDKEENNLDTSKKSSYAAVAATSGVKKEVTSEQKENKNFIVMEDEALEKILLENGARDSTDEPNFEEMFEKFASLKEKASSLEGEERKKYAEKVAIAFWRAIGGPEDEIEGLDDLDSE
ncbi:alpha- and gamma-adaptin-binding protein p34 [Caerostris extrusa]|uniref:Alpha- and gamma-adaptin-binding protein p34 n=1 Tax=Caerostris extrusa TaxID=172846 RepID=A0AAV4QTB8_CAEEX|nr:alpha- and gamma-adaptin-binding protein p34 [Caerostris extrusa]